MKVLVFDRFSTEEFCDDVTVEMIPDSAIIKDGKPFFIPANSASWRYSCGVAMRICRLGKNISEKFAPRYIDAYAPCITTVPMPVSGFNAFNRCHEGAVIIGEWQSPESFSGKIVFHCGDISKSIDVNPDLAVKMVALAGSHGVMKIGDIIVMNEDILADDIQADTRITASGENGEFLNFAIK